MLSAETARSLMGDTRLLFRPCHRRGEPRCQRPMTRLAARETQPEIPPAFGIIAVDRVQHRVAAGFMSVCRRVDRSVALHDRNLVRHDHWPSSNWPLRQAMVRWGLGRKLTAMLLLLLSLSSFALPILVMAPISTGQLAQGMQTVQAYFREAPAQPDWLTGVPLVGNRLGQIWKAAYCASSDLGAALAPYAAAIRHMLLAVAGGAHREPYRVDLVLDRRDHVLDGR